jgi:hypothetical protein
MDLCEHTCEGIITYVMVNDLGEDKRRVSIRCERTALPKKKYCEYCTTDRMVLPVPGNVMDLIEEDHVKENKE